MCADAVDAEAEPEERCRPHRLGVGSLGSWGAMRFGELIELRRKDVDLDLTTAAVNAAIDEYDELGSEAFLAKYGFGPANRPNLFGCQDFWTPKRCISWREVVE